MNPVPAVFTLLLTTGLCLAEPLTLPEDRRPDWLRRDGIVMAGSWEPLIFRVRRDGGEGYTPSIEQVEAYRREHSPEMIRRLKELGVNFVMLHCYKGGGRAAEQESMADAVRFARLCQEAGLRVGVYNFSGAFIWELLFKEVPSARDWVVLNPAGQPTTYGAAGYRYYWNRNHPEAQTYHQQIVRFAVEEIRADLIHFDNYHVGPGRDRCSVERFQDYLRKTFPRDKLTAHHIDPSTAQPPPPKAMDLLSRAWADFSCQSMADSYRDMCQYARALRSDLLVECNPHGVRPDVRPPIDHGRLLQGGEAYWDESRQPAYRNGQLQSRIRTCKVARSMHNTAFAYTTSALEAAESMAFNLDSLGAICWFEYAKIVQRPGSTAPLAPALAPFVRFFHQRRDLLRATRVVADVGVLRSFPSMAFGPPDTARLTGLVEDTLIINRVPFQILHEHQLAEASKYRVLVLAGCVALSDSAVDALRRYARRGGRLCVVGPLATHDEWMLPRSSPALADLPAASFERAATPADTLSAILRASDERLSIRVEAAPGLCLELTEQANRRLVHLVNYREDGAVENVSIDLQHPAGNKVTSVTAASPEHDHDLPLAFEQNAGRLHFTVPRVQTYEIAVVTWQ